MHFNVTVESRLSRRTSFFPLVDVMQGTGQDQFLVARSSVTSRFKSDINLATFESNGVAEMLNLHLRFMAALVHSLPEMEYGIPSALEVQLILPKPDE